MTTKIFNVRKTTKTFVHKVSDIIHMTAKNPKKFLLFLFSRFYTIRLIAHWLAGDQNVSLVYDKKSLFDISDVHATVESLHREGLFLGLKLPSETLKTILHYTNSHDCYAGRDPSLGFRLSEKETLERALGCPFYIAEYFNVTQRCPAIWQLANDPTLRGIANLYLGKKAQFTGSWLTWTFPFEGASYDPHQQEALNFHYDQDDFSSLRFFFYLNDVTAESGPHVCVRGSHKRKSLRHILNFLSRKQTNEFVSKFYGTDNVVCIYGSAGFGFIEDTFCIHKGTLPKSQPRLMLQLHFAVSNYNYGKYNDYRDPELLKSFKQSKSLSKLS